MITKREAVLAAQRTIQSELESCESIDFSFLIITETDITLCAIASSPISEDEESYLQECFSEFVASVYEDGYRIDMMIIKKEDRNYEDRLRPFDYAIITQKS
jgi:hypothetical protein